MPEKTRGVKFMGVASGECSPRYRVPRRQLQAGKMSRATETAKAMSAILILDLVQQGGGLPCNDVLDELSALKLHKATLSIRLPL